MNYHSGMMQFPGYEAIGDVLKRRGHILKTCDPVGQLLLPAHLVRPEFANLDSEVAPFRTAFGSKSFRKLLREVVLGRNGWVPLERLRGIAGRRTAEYIGIIARLGQVETSSEGVRLTRVIDSSSHTLEWYIANLCERELSGSAAWGVRLEGLPSGGDYDALAWLSPVLLYVEAKAKRHTNVKDQEILRFLQRHNELAPEVSVLMIDTDEDLTEFIDRVNELTLDVYRKAYGYSPEWKPERPTYRLQAGFLGVYHGIARTYITNTEPSIVTQLRRCLRHYHMHVRETAFLGRSAGTNWLTGERYDG